MKPLHARHNQCAFSWGKQNAAAGPAKPCEPTLIGLPTRIRPSLREHLLCSGAERDPCRIVKRVA